MAQFDNRSSYYPVNAFTTPDLSGTSGITEIIDTTSFAGGYTIIISAGGILGGTTTLTATIETSDQNSSGFESVPDSQIIGGTNGFIIADPLIPGQGKSCYSRGVLSQKKFVRVVFSAQVATTNTIVSVVINSRIGVAPSAIVEGTFVAS